MREMLTKVAGVSRRCATTLLVIAASVVSSVAVQRSDKVPLAGVHGVAAQAPATVGAIYASDFGVVVDGSDCADQLQAALNAAAQQRTVLILPAGMVHVSKPLSVTLDGAMGLRGLGRRLSYLQFDGPIDGLIFDGSQGNQLNNCVEVSGLTLAGNPSAGTAMKVDFGTAPIAGAGSNEVCSLAHISNVEIVSWTNGIYLGNVWNGVFERLFLCGGQSVSQASGAGSGSAITLAGCVSDQLSNVTATFWTKGIFFTQFAAGYACQGIQVNNYVAEAIPLGVNNDTPDDCTTVPFQCVQLANIAIDNGNTPNAQNGCVSLFNCEGLSVVGGQFLQKGGFCQTYLRNCTNVTLAGIDFTRQDGSTAQTKIQYSICLDGTSSGCMVSGCQFGDAAAVLLNSGTTGNRVQGNGYGKGGVLNLGKKNQTE